jgi:hypothetical protein
MSYWNRDWTLQPSFIAQPTHPNNEPQTYCSIFPSRKGVAQYAYPINPSTTAFRTATDISDNKKSHIHFQLSSCGGGMDLISRSQAR